jgi:hypothetical protein
MLVNDHCEQNYNLTFLVAAINCAPLELSLGVTE